MSAVVSRLDIFARCTYYDGDALSVREALALGVPVVASDTDYRPEGVIKFRIADGQELVRALKHALAHLSEGTTVGSSHAHSNGSERISRLYRELIEEKG